MKPIRWVTRTITWASLGIAGGAVVVTARHLLSTPQPLESGLAGEGRIDRRREGDTYYNVAGPEEADPLVLLHDFYPGASNYEFRRIFPRLAADYRVYALDWLGFGMSERPALAYTGEFYAHLLSGFLRETVGKPATVLAHGLAANVAVRAASDEPDLFNRLVLVAPHAQAGTELGPTLPQILVRAAQRSSLGLVPYAALATRSALRWQLRRRAAHNGVGAATDDVLDHAYASSHQFGGHHALLALLTGELDLPMQNAFALLEPPVLVVRGELDALHPHSPLEDLALLNANAHLLTIANAGDAVFEDEPASFIERVRTWLRTPRARLVPRPPAAWSPDAAPASLTEQFGEPRGFVTPAPGLESLEGLAEQAPEAVPLQELEGSPASPASPLDQSDQPDQIRQAMDAPEAPVPTTLAAMTAPLDDEAPREEEGTIDPTSGPHPVPADRRDLSPPAAATPPDESPHEPVVMILDPADETLAVPPSPGVGEPATPTEPPQATWPADVADATVLTAQALAEIEERAGSEAQQVDDAIRAAGPQPPSEARASGSHTGAAPPAEPTAAPPSGRPAGKSASKAESSGASSATPRTTGAGDARRRSGSLSAPGSAAAPEKRGAGSGKSAGGAQRSGPGAGGRKSSSRKGKHSHK